MPSTADTRCRADRPRGHFFGDDPRRWRLARARGVLAPAPPPPAELRELRAEVARLRELVARLRELVESAAPEPERPAAPRQRKTTTIRLGDV